MTVFLWNSVSLLKQYFRRRTCAKSNDCASYFWILFGRRTGLSVLYLSPGKVPIES